MSDAVIYSFLSHDCRLLAGHVASLRKMLVGSVRIEVVQGPTGRYAMTSGGNIRLRADAARQLNVSAINVPESLAGLLMPERFSSIVDWVWRTVASRQVERYALFVHGDLFPVAPFLLSELHQGMPLAGRGIRHLHGWRIPMTWLSIDMSSIDRSVVSFSNPYLRAESDRLFDHKIKLWESRSIHPSELPQCLATIGSYEKDLRWEWCDPIWLHTDKLSTYGSSSYWDALQARKLVLLDKVLAGLGVQVDLMGDPCDQLAGLVNHAPRIISHPITEDFDVELERRRARQGGCCGAPTE